LKEYYCDNNEINYEDYTCAGECDAGICVTVAQTCGSVVLADCADPADFVECREEYEGGSATEAEFLSCKEIFDNYINDLKGRSLSTEDADILEKAEKLYDEGKEAEAMLLITRIGI